MSEAGCGELKPKTCPRCRRRETHVDGVGRLARHKDASGAWCPWSRKWWGSKPLNKPPAEAVFNG